MSKKTTEKAVVCFCAIAMCFVLLFCHENRIDAAVVVEEEAIISKEADENMTEQNVQSVQAPAEQNVQSAQVPAEQKRQDVQAPLEQTSPVPAEQTPHVETEKKTTSNVFRIPTRKQVEQKKTEMHSDKMTGKTQEKEQEEMPQEQTEFVKTATGRTGWFLAVGGILLLCGFARIIWRLKRR